MSIEQDEKSMFFYKHISQVTAEQWAMVVNHHRLYISAACACLCALAHAGVNVCLSVY